MGIWPDVPNRQKLCSLGRQSIVFVQNCTDLNSLDETKIDQLAYMDICEGAIVEIVAKLFLLLYKTHFLIN